ncbi:hypothetical protein D3C81_1289010 [compost metagenome]
MDRLPVQIKIMGHDDDVFPFHVDLFERITWDHPQLVRCGEPLPRCLVRRMIRDGHAPLQPASQAAEQARIVADADDDQLRARCDPLQQQLQLRAALAESHQPGPPARAQQAGFLRRGGERAARARRHGGGIGGTDHRRRHVRLARLHAPPQIAEDPVRRVRRTDRIKRLEPHRDRPVAPEADSPYLVFPDAEVVEQLARLERPKYLLRMLAQVFFDAPAA